MEIIMKANGNKAKKMDSASIHFGTAIFILVNGNWINLMDLENIFYLMEIVMKDNINKAK